MRMSFLLEIGSVNEMYFFKRVTSKIPNSCVIFSVSMPSDNDVLSELDLGEPSQELLNWAKENINEDPETRCQKIQDLRDMIFGMNLVT